MFGANEPPQPGRDNPFAAPETEGRGPIDGPRPIALPGKVAQLTLYGSLAFLVVVLVVEIGLLFNPYVFEQDDFGLFWGLALLLYLFAIGGHVLLRVACSIAWFIWSYRIAVNLRSVPSSGLSTTPGWVVGWWFVPFANLFKPYQVHKELFQASTPDDASLRAPAYLGMWWISFIAGNVISNISFRLGVSELSAVLDLVSTSFMMTMAVTSILLIKDLTSRHHRWLEEQGLGTGEGG